MGTYTDIADRFFEAGHHTPGNDAYYGLSLAEALEGIKRFGSIDELRIPGLSDDEADEFWHAVNV